MRIPLAAFVTPPPPGLTMDDIDAPPDIVNATPDQDDEWALGTGPIRLGVPKPPWLETQPPRKKKFNWPNGGKSPSWFRQFSRCHLEHANRYRRKIADPSGLDAVIGDVIHGAIEDACVIRAKPGRRGKIPSVINPDELIYLAELQAGAVRQNLDVIEGAPVGMIVTTEVLARCRHIIAGMKSIDASNIWVDNSRMPGVEYLWSYHLGDKLLIAGVADLVQIQPNPSNSLAPPLEVTITDWKTGEWQMPTQEELELDAQAGLELCWARRQFPHTPTIRFKIVNVSLGEEVSIEWSEGLDQLVTAFARSCWHQWSIKNESAQTGSHCKFCAYRHECAPYAKHLQAETLRPRTGLREQGMPELIRTFRQTKTLLDMAEQRKKDCAALIMSMLGKQKTYRAGSLLARKKRRALTGFRDQRGMLESLATVTLSGFESLVGTCTTIKKRSLEGWVKTLSMSKQQKARKVIESHEESYYTPYWVEVTEKESVI